MPYVPSPRRRFSESDKTGDTKQSISFLRKPQRVIEDDMQGEMLLKLNTTRNKTGDYSGKEEAVEEGDNLFSYLSPLVRKKSGELVKSSLRLNLLHKGSKSLPTTPSSKQVHFGNDIDVKYFDEHDKPNTISAPNSPYNSDGEESIDSEEEAVDDNYPEDNNSIDDESLVVIDKSETRELLKLCNTSKSYTKHETHKNLDKFKKAMEGWYLDSTVFPEVSYCDNFDLETPIFLERCFLSIEKTKLIGQIAVKNLTFKKFVTVRYTYNNWVSTINIDAQYLPDTPRNLKKNGYDRFSFQLSIPTMFSRYFSANPIVGNMTRPPHFEFCIKFNANNQMEFWDNNHFKNYRLQFIYKPEMLSTDEHNEHLEMTPEAMHNRYLKSTLDNLKPTAPKMKLKKSRNFIRSFSTGDLGDVDQEQQELQNKEVKQDVNSHQIANEDESSFKLKKHLFHLPHHKLRKNDGDNFDDDDDDDDDSLFGSSSDFPLHFSIDKVKNDRFDWFNRNHEDIFHSIPLMRPERGSEIRRTNEDNLKKLNNRADEIKANHLDLPDSDSHVSDDYELSSAIPKYKASPNELEYPPIGLTDYEDSIDPLATETSSSSDVNLYHQQINDVENNTSNHQHHHADNLFHPRSMLINPLKRDPSSYKNLIEKYCFFQGPGFNSSKLHNYDQYLYSKNYKAGIKEVEKNNYKTNETGTENDETDVLISNNNNNNNNSNGNENGSNNNSNSNNEKYPLTSYESSFGNFY